LGDAHGEDGLATLPDRAVDVTIADPPFDGRAHRCAAERTDWRARRRALGALPFPPLTQAQLEQAATQLARVTRRWIVVFAGETQLDAWRRALDAGGARFIRFGIAERVNPRPQLSGDRPAPPADLLVIAHGIHERMRWAGGGRPARWASGAARFDQRDREQLHPTQKALALMGQLVRDFTEPGELVLDPFAGSGTTLVAAKRLGRRALGWEVNADWHEVAQHRLEAAREQLELDAAAPTLGEQLELVNGR
jgi:site-specific DNA-methyltransferase (adenine-specific)